MGWLDNLSTQGYKESSPDKNRKWLTIPDSDITMKNVNGKVMAYPQNGNPTMMYPGQDYQFPGSDYVHEVKMQQGGNTPTQQDSLDLYNNAKKVNDFYNKGNYKMTSTSPAGNGYNQDNDGAYSQYLQKHSPSVPVNEYRKDLDDNRYLQRDLENSVVNPNAPMQLFDKRVSPQNKNTYDYTGTDSKLVGDKVSIYQYDPISVKPYNMLTELERVERTAKYPGTVKNIQYERDGKGGVIQSPVYHDDHSEPVWFRGKYQMGGTTQQMRDNYENAMGWMKQNNYDVNNPALRHDKSIGTGYFNDYNKANPDKQFNPANVPDMQNYFQQNKNSGMVRNTDPSGRGFSNVDSFPADQTLNSRQMTYQTQNNKGPVQSYGTNQKAAQATVNSWASNNMNSGWEGFGDPKSDINYKPPAAQDNTLQSNDKGIPMTSVQKDNWHTNENADYSVDSVRAKNGGWLDSMKYDQAWTMQKGGYSSQQQAQIQQDGYNTRKPDLGLAPLDPNFVFLTQNAPNPSTINTSPQRKNVIQKAATIARNPMTALRYKTQGQDIPDNLERGDRSNYDNAFDVVNPMTYLDAAGRTLSGKHFREEGFTPDALVKTGLDAGMIYGVGRDYSIGDRNIVNPLGNKVEYNIPIHNDLLNLDKQRGFALSWQRGKLTPEQWENYKDLSKRQWIETPRKPINVPTIEYAPPMRFENYADPLNPMNGQRASEWWVRDENTNRVTVPGMRFSNTQQLQQSQQVSQSPRDNSSTPLNYNPNRQDTAPTKPISKVKKSLTRTVEDVDKQDSTKQDSQKVYEWLHSHNNEEPQVDSVKRVDSNKKYGGQAQKSKLEWLKSYEAH